MSSKLCVVGQIKMDHENVRDLYSRYKSESNTQKKKDIALTLVREMAVHAVAEEQSVYKEYSKIGLSDASDHAKEDHAQVHKLIASVAAKDFDSPNYDDALTKAYNTFDEHAKEEEKDQLPIVMEKMSADERDKSAREFLKSRQKALSGPDKGGIFVELKQSHPTV